VLVVALATVFVLHVRHNRRVSSQWTTNHCRLVWRQSAQMMSQSHHTLHSTPEITKCCVCADND
jgi:hypothetical protein